MTVSSVAARRVESGKRTDVVEGGGGGREVEGFLEVVDEGVKDDEGDSEG